jgi:hypothetical protein
MGNMMGLSDNRDSKLKYAMRVYNHPSFGEWHKWYAWYPVRIVKFHRVELTTFGVGEFFIKTYQWVWLKEVARRKVIDELDGPGREGAGSKIYYEYTTTMELLASGY